MHRPTVWLNFEIRTHEGKSNCGIPEQSARWSESIHPANSDRLSVYRSVFKILSYIFHIFQFRLRSFPKKTPLHNSAVSRQTECYYYKLNAIHIADRLRRSVLIHTPRRWCLSRRYNSISRRWKGACRTKFEAPIWNQLDGLKIKYSFKQFRFLSITNSVFVGCVLEMFNLNSKDLPYSRTSWLFSFSSLTSGLQTLKSKVRTFKTSMSYFSSTFYSKQ